MHRAAPGGRFLPRFREHSLTRVTRISLPRTSSRNARTRAAVTLPHASQRAFVGDYQRWRLSLAASLSRETQPSVVRDLPAASYEKGPHSYTAYDPASDDRTPKEYTHIGRLRSVAALTSTTSSRTSRRLRLYSCSFTSPRTREAGVSEARGPRVTAFELSTYLSSNDSVLARVLFSCLSASTST